MLVECFLFSCFYQFLHILSLEGKITYLGEVGSEEFLMKLTSQITEMVSAKITQGKSILWSQLLLI